MASAPSPSPEVGASDRPAGSWIRPARAGARAIRLRPSEWLLLAYFLYAASASPLWGARQEIWIPRAGLTLAGVVFLLLLAWAEAVTAHPRFFNIVRDWLPAPLILTAYWAVDWFVPATYPHTHEQSWIVLDRLLLNTWGGKAAIECFGCVLPFFLELTYSLLYAIPPVSIGVLYLCRRRDRVDRFLFMLLLGTLAVYVLLPMFPSEAPRILFPGQDLPACTTPFRLLNLWLLDGWDIRGSVFPSGHVTVAFSAAFAMLLAVPERRRVGWTMAGLAGSVAVTTVYARYHYAVDGLAGCLISLTTCAVGARFYPIIRRIAIGEARQ
jgi:membrane-associated phospholipid phosphatase